MTYDSLSQSQWLATLTDPGWVLTMNTCRCDYLKTRWEIPEREMDEHLVYFIDSGPMQARLSGRGEPMESGTVVWVPPGSTRALWGDNRELPLRYYKMRFTLTRGTWNATFGTVAIKPQAWELLPILRMLVAEAASDAPWKTEQLRSLLSVFSTSFFRLPLQNRLQRRSLTAQQREVIEEFVTMHMDVHVSSTDLARAVHLSQDYFSRIFVRTYGEAPRSYVKRMRIRHAANRLTESLISVKELAAEMGYNNVNLFCRQFKEVEGMTPTQYRRR